MKNNRKKNLEYWLNLPEGRIQDENTIKGIYNHSESLDTLYRKGIDITSLYKFSLDEIEVARLMGAIYSEEPRIIEGIKKNINDDKPLCRLGIKARFYHKTMKLLKELAKFNVIHDDFFYALKSRKEENVYNPIEYKKVKSMIRHESNSYVYICYMPTEDATSRSFFVGHWFNAYSYYIVNEHLSRNRLDFEIYTMVDYQTPTDILNAKGDFDILALVNDKVLMVECKFSKIGHPGYERMIQKVIQKSDELKIVFDVTTRAFEYIPILLYSKALVKEEFLEATFGETDFHCIDISDLRSSISDVLIDKPKAKEVPVIKVEKPIMSIKVEEKLITPIKVEKTPKSNPPKPAAKRKRKRRRIIQPDYPVNGTNRRTPTRKEERRVIQKVVRESLPKRRLSFLQRLRRMLSGLFS
jgi:hypothetical protein